MKPAVVVALALAVAVPSAVGEPLVRGSDRPSLVQQQPSYGESRRVLPPLHRYELDERLRDLDRDSAKGELDPFERRDRLETRQELHELDRSLERE
ncbi:MAG TPA: hypothetical protein VFO41_09680 [Alphaproteobacteria bacterium]|nr:hypothetical protein [Alphaproteobacteria bacterium]